MKRILVFLFVLASALAMQAALLAPNGQAYRCIVLKGDDTRAASLAARELQTWLKAEFGRELPIAEAKDLSGPAILVGRAAGLSAGLQGKPSDAFQIRTQSNGDLCIAGVDEEGGMCYGLRGPWRSIDLYNDSVGVSLLEAAGTACGAYAFLEDQCGIRFYGIGPDGTDVPTLSELKLGALEVDRAPRFSYRYPLISVLAKDEDTACWARRVGFGGASPIQIIDSFFFMTMKYEKTHPEFFALLPNGKRALSNELTVTGGGSLCLHSDAMMKAWIDDIADYFASHPSFDIYPVTPNDGLRGICSCPQCQADLQHPHKEGTGDYSWHVWDFINRMARMLSARCPGKYIGCLAYEAYEDIPAGMAFEPNVAVMLCHARGGMTNPEEAAEFHARSAAWGKVAGRLYYWDWYLTHWPPTHNLPIFYSQTIQREIRAMAANPKVSGEFIEAENRPQSYAFDNDRPGQPAIIQPNLYLTAKLQWDPSRDTQAILEEFYRRYYGPAEAPMREFWTTAEKRRTAAFEADRAAAPESYFDAACIERLTKLLEQAAKLCPKDSVYARRVAELTAECAPGFQRVTAMRSRTEAMLKVPKLTDPAKLTELCPPQHFVSVDGLPVEPQTWLYAGYDRSTLYLKVSCFEPEMDKLQVNSKGRDAGAPWADDCVEFFVCPDAADRAQCYHLIITAAGAIYDGRQTASLAMDLGWNATGKIQTDREADGWSVSLALPFADIGITDPNFTGDLALGVYRTRMAAKPPQISAWSPTGETLYFLPAKFGRLILTK